MLLFLNYKAARHESPTTENNDLATRYRKRVAIRSISILDSLFREAQKAKRRHLLIQRLVPSVVTSPLCSKQNEHKIPSSTHHEAVISHLLHNLCASHTVQVPDISLAHDVLVP